VRKAAGKPYAGSFLICLILEGKGMVLREERETVAAIATALGEGGIGIIRISGEKAFEIADAVLDRPISGAPGYSMNYRHVLDNGEVLDEVLASVFRAPHSFTGEDSVEINCHGGLFLLQRVLDAVLRAGARPSEPGEFSKRAFLNGRIDLAQAEAVMDLIGAKNEYALQAAMNQLDGRLSDKMRALRSDILDEIAWIEAALDDPENYDLEGYPELLSARIATMLASLEELLQSADDGRLFREGIPTVILGLPNAGKSSLMNLLTQNDAAIVTDIAGTTRDILTEQVRLGKLLLTLSDTAGIRESEDQIERIGVERARKAAEAAELLLLVLDGSKPLSEEEKELLSYAGKRRSILLLNKADLGQRIDERELLSVYGPGKILRFSTKTGEGLASLEETVTELFFEGVFDNRNEVLSVNARHKEVLREAIESLRNVQASVAAGMPEDFFSIDLSAAYRALGTITGDSVEDDVINRIFEKFCTGK
jgi:tRNA modification GTPase trmE